MKTADIVVGKTYRTRGINGRELKPRTVVSFDPTGRLPGGVVSSHHGLTRSGKQSQTCVWAANYFILRVIPEIAP